MGVIFYSSILDILFVTSMIVTYLYFWIRSKYSFWEIRGIKYIKPTVPFGNVRDVVLKRTTIAELFRDLYKHFPEESIVGTFQLLTPVLLIRDPELAKCMLVKDFGHFQDRGFKFDGELDPLSKHLIYLNGYTWRYLRTKLTPTFSSGKMKIMFQLVSECANQLKKHLEEPARKQEIIEIKGIMTNYTIDVIGSCAFGININALNEPNSEFKQMGQRVLDPTFWNAFRATMKLLLPRLTTFLRIKGVSDDIKNFFINITKDMIEYREKNNVVRKDFLQLLMQMKNQGNIHDDENHNKQSDVTSIHEETKTEELNIDRDRDVVLTDNLLAAQLFVFFLAGFETSSTTLTFCTYELALNPHIQTLLREEIDKVMEECDGNITYECVQNMSYLRKVVDETLRLYPPISNLVRVATKPYVVPGTNLHLEVGHKIMVPICGIHRDPNYYPDPLQFDPERFTEEAKASRPNYTYMPFGAGPRNCIGYRFGELETKLGLITLFSNYELSICEKTVVPAALDPNHIFISPLGGLWLRIKKRN